MPDVFMDVIALLFSMLLTVAILAAASGAIVAIFCHSFEKAKNWLNR